MSLFPFVCAASALALLPVSHGTQERSGAILYVDAARGSDDAPGTEARPTRSLSAAIARLPDPVTEATIIHVSGGRLASTGGVAMPENRLDLMRRMRPGVTVSIVGLARSDGTGAVLAWEGGEAMVVVREGEWRLERLTIGDGSTRQRRGVMVSGAARVTIKDTVFRTRSHSDAAVYADRGGLAELRGLIDINGQMHDAEPEADSFSGIVATHHGRVAFTGDAGSRLTMGNGSLSAEYYGVIELQCQDARITNWTDQSNLIAVNNSGRVDLHGTPTRLCARRKGNTPIGLEHDGHVLAEGARIMIEGENDHAIVLQKASSFFCNDVALTGAFRWALTAMSGSTLLAGIVGDAHGIEADTGARIIVERVGGKITGPVEARRSAVIVLPDKTVVSP